MNTQEWHLGSCKVGQVSIVIPYQVPMVQLTPQDSKRGTITLDPISSEDARILAALLIAAAEAVERRNRGGR